MGSSWYLSGLLKAKRVTIICNSYPPENGGAPTRIYNLALLLRDAGYDVEVITAMPNYPKGAIFPPYRGRLTQHEVAEGISIRRIWVYPSNSNRLVPRALSMLSHMASLCLLALPRLLVRRPRLAIVSSPPLLSAFVAMVLVRLLRIKTLLNVSDIWPASAAHLGALQQGWLYRTLQHTERRMYRMAQGVSGQSREIVAHVAPFTKAPVFCYRNLQVKNKEAALPRPAGVRKIIYAGLLGVAQGVLDICQTVPFAQLGTTLDIYGDGLERAAIAAAIADNPGCGIMLHSTVPMQAMPALLAQYHATLIPLKTAIHGAVPSKLFMAIASGLPVLWCSGGEGETMVREYGLGRVSAAGDAAALQQQVAALVSMDDRAFELMRARVLQAGEGPFNPATQRSLFLAFIETIITGKGAI